MKIKYFYSDERVASLMRDWHEAEYTREGDIFCVKPECNIVFEEALIGDMLANEDGEVIVCDARNTELCSAFLREGTHKIIERYLEHFLWPSEISQSLI